MRTLIKSLVLGMLMILSLNSSADAAAIKLTPAQNLLFDGAHLINVPSGATLNYNFEKSGTLGTYSDTVQLAVGKESDDGGKDLEVKFLTGERRLPGGILPRFHNNALIMMFLQYDVMELEKITGGSRVYFRNRIRGAFSQPLMMNKTQVNFDGKRISATEVVIAPFAKDLLGEKFRKYTRRTYRFVMSEDIPGEIYLLSSTTRSENGETIIKSIMTFVSMETNHSRASQ